MAIIIYSDMNNIILYKYWNILYSKHFYCTSISWMQYYLNLYTVYLYLKLRFKCILFYEWRLGNS